MSRQRQILTCAANHVEDRSEELTETLVPEEGKTRDEATAEVQRAVDILYYFGNKACDVGDDVRLPRTIQMYCCNPL